MPPLINDQPLNLNLQTVNCYTFDWHLGRNKKQKWECMNLYYLRFAENGMKWNTFPFTVLYTNGNPLTTRVTAMLYIVVKPFQRLLKRQFFTKGYCFNITSFLPFLLSSAGYFKPCHSSALTPEYYLQTYPFLASDFIAASSILLFSDAIQPPPTKTKRIELLQK